MNSAALLGRMNFALNLTANKVAGVSSTLPATVDPDSMAQSLIGTNLTADSRKIVQEGIAPPPQGGSETQLPIVKFQQPTPASIAGLTLGSPDFQRR
jgi:hypothetical protein